MADQRALLALAQDPDPSVPLWWRVYVAAMSRMQQNQHARFEPEELHSWMVVATKKTGAVRLVTKSKVSQGIAICKTKGLVLPESDVRCIVLPLDAIRGGTHGRREDRCEYHDGIALRGQRSSAQLPSKGKPVAPAGQTMSESRWSADRSSQESSQPRPQPPHLTAQPNDTACNCGEAVCNCQEHTA